MKPSFEPVIYTRTHQVDYEIIAAPESLRANTAWAKLLRHVQYAMSDEGMRGPLKDRRWHIATVQDRVLVGIATYEFRCEDFAHRPIRGYYGMLMDSDEAFIPTPEAFQQLYAQYVKPVFYNPKHEENYWTPLVCDMVIPAWMTRVTGIVTTSEKIAFNNEEGCVKFFPYGVDIEKMLYSALLEAISCAKSSKEFEFVWGLASKAHALEVPFKNVVCGEIEHETTIQVAAQTPNSGTNTSSHEKNRNNRFDHERRKSRERYSLEIEGPAESQSVFQRIVNAIIRILARFFPDWKLIDRSTHIRHLTTSPSLSIQPRLGIDPPLRGQNTDDLADGIRRARLRRKENQADRDTFAKS